MNILNLIRGDRPSTQADVLKRIDEDVRTMTTRGRFMGETLDFGPNFVHAAVFRSDGTVEDLGWSKNLKTTVGMDWLHRAMGGRVNVGGVSNTISATSVVKTAAGWTVDAYKGSIVVCPVTGLTTQPVWANIGSNTSDTLTIDSWKNADDSAGTTPASGNGFSVHPGMGAGRYIGLTTDGTAPNVANTTLASEITTGGLARALATFAHSGGATTYTLTKTWTASGGHTGVHKAGLFTAENTTAAGILIAETVLSADATLVSGDSLQVTWTWTLPAAG